MKRGFIIIAIFVILIGCCITEEVVLQTNLEKLHQKALELKDLVSQNEDVNTDEIKNAVLSLETFWSKTESYFCVVVNHINMEEAGEQVAKIKTYTEQNKKEELLVELDLLIYYSESYEHILVPSIQNIL